MSTKETAATVKIVNESITPKSVFAPLCHSSSQAITDLLYVAIGFFVVSRISYTRNHPLSSVFVALFAVRVIVLRFIHIVAWDNS